MHVSMHVYLQKDSEWEHGAQGYGDLLLNHATAVTALVAGLQPTSLVLFSGGPHQALE